MSLTKLYTVLTLICHGCDVKSRSENIIQDKLFYIIPDEATSLCSLFRNSGKGR